MRYDTEESSDTKPSSPKIATHISLVPVIISSLRWLWTVLYSLYIYWTLLSDMPIDLFYRLLTASNHQDAPLGRIPEYINDSSYLGQMSLHPDLPLLAYAFPRSFEIAFYSTKDYRYLWKSEITLEYKDEESRKLVQITKLQFSKGNKLAVGLSNGKVCIIGQDLVSRMEYCGGSEKVPTTSTYHYIRLLAIHDAKTCAKTLGRITNLVFSPNIALQGEGAWLAITTEYSGIWMWNKWNNLVVRVVNTGGVAEECLHWIDHKRNTADNHMSGISKATDLRRFTGNAWLETKPSKKQQAQNSSVSQGNGSQVGDSLIVFGTRDGKIRVQRLWHSYRMMQLQGYLEFSLSILGYPTADVNNGLAGGISHLSLVQAQLEEPCAALSLLAAFADEGSSKIHLFTVALTQGPLSNETTFREGGVLHLLTVLGTYADSLLRVSANALLFGTDYRWPPRAPEGVLYHPKPQRLELDSISGKFKARLFSMASISGSDLVLMILHPSTIYTFGPAKSHQSVLYSYSHSPQPALHHVCEVDHCQRYNRQQALAPKAAVSKGYYSSMLEMAGVTNMEEPNLDAGSEMLGLAHVDESVKCGLVAWSKRYGKDIGAFVYQPMRMGENDGMAIALFEVV